MAFIHPSDDNEDDDDDDNDNEDDDDNDDGVKPLRAHISALESLRTFFNSFFAAPAALAAPGGAAGFLKIAPGGNWMMGFRARERRWRRRRRKRRRRIRHYGPEQPNIQM